MDINALRLFVSVAELGGLTKAAAASDSTQSAISRQIAQLEAECGGKLFLRAGRGMRLSDLGATILHRAKNMLREADQISAEAREMAGVPTGEVRIGLLPVVATVLVSKLFKDARNRFPRVKLSLFEGY